MDNPIRIVVLLIFFSHFENFYAKLNNEISKEYQLNADSYVGKFLTIIKNKLLLSGNYKLINVS